MQFRTPRWIFALFFLIGIGFLIIPAHKQNEKLANDVPRFEATQKQLLIDQDLSITNELCRTQCKTDLIRVLQELQHTPKLQINEKLQLLRTEHPHILSVLWARPNSGQAIRSGTYASDISKKLEPYQTEAKQSLQQGKVYHSPSVQVDHNHYMLLAVPAPDGGSLTGVIKQSILSEIQNQQKRNLRLVPYPSEGNYRVESVDSDTKRDVRVDNGEENGGVSHYHKEQVVVKFNTIPDRNKMSQIKQAIHATSVMKLGYTYVFESHQLTAEQMMTYFKKADNVAYVEPHYYYMTNNEPIPNDDLFAPHQWNLPITQTVEGWGISKGNDNIIIAVLDTGVDLNHPDLQGRLVDGLNIIQPEQAPSDDVGHGTHVTGVISATVNNLEGVAGMTWYDKVMPIKVLDQSGAGTTYSVAQGIIWATDHGAKVINMSLGNYAQAEFLHDAVRYAYDRDVVLIAASGNDNTDQPGYPAAYPEVFAVAATDQQQQRAPFSNYGDYIDIAAPGVSIASTYPDNQYAALSGTSMASPHVAALAALIRSVNPLLNNTEVMNIMRDTANDLGKRGKDDQFGYGQINVKQALIQASNTKNSVRLFPEWVKREIEYIRSKYIAS
ncbi:MAG: S8 family peptidase [Paenibacillaceae bacterium]